MQRAIGIVGQSEVEKLASGRVAYWNTPVRPWLQDLWLWILLVGPLAAPLFVALGVPVLRPFADGIYLLGEAVCPKVDVHLEFLGEPMAVCSSCWAAVFGLWAVRLAYGRAGEGFGPLSLERLWARWRGVPTSARVGVLLVSFMPWAIDVMLWDMGAWSSPQGYMMLAGLLGGLGAGALLLPAAAEARQRRDVRGLDSPEVETSSYNGAQPASAD